VELKIPEDQMRSLVAGAVMQTLTSESRENLIKTAIMEHLLKPSGKRRNSWDPPPQTPLQQAFNNAVYKVAQDVCEEMLKKDDTLKKQVESLYADACKQVFEGEGRQKLVYTLAGTISSALSQIRS
jgi:hypothetical protein